jgi:hypothetical protein
MVRAPHSLLGWYQRSEEHPASTFTSNLKTEAVYSSETLVPTYKIATQRLLLLI